MHSCRFRCKAGWTGLIWSRFPAQSDKLGSPGRRTAPDDGEAEAVFGGVQGEGALGAIRSELTVSQLVAKHGVHQTLLNAWKKQAMEGMAGMFSGRFRQVSRQV
ncbi:Mobile element protein [Azospirillum endophyticum]